MMHILRLDLICLKYFAWDVGISNLYIIKRIPQHVGDMGGRNSQITCFIVR